MIEVHLNTKINCGVIILHELEYRPLKQIWYHADMPETLWGAAVPNNYHKVLGDLVDEMYGDYDYTVRCPHFTRPDILEFD